MKIMFLILVLLCSGGVFAQHINVVNQTGSENISYVEQEFYTNQNIFNSPHVAYVDQIGSENKSSVEQIKSAADPNSGLADIYQNGLSNSSKVKQNNFSHFAYVVQNGQTNISRIDQYQGVTTAGVFQNGTSNFGKIEEHGVASSAIIIQCGVENKSKQFMGSTDKGVLLSSFTSYQAGNYNMVKQEMDGYSPALNNNNVGCITQIGESNLGRQKMFNDGSGISFRAHDNFSTTLSMGNNNESFQYMKRYENSSEVTQFGNSNISVSHQNW